MLEVKYPKYVLPREKRKRKETEMWGKKSKTGKRSIGQTLN